MLERTFSIRNIKIKQEQNEIQEDRYKMDRFYRILIGGFLAFLAIVFFVLTEIFKADSTASSSSSNITFFPLMIVIAVLVVIVVPAIFVVIKLLNR